MTKERDKCCICGKLGSMFRFPRKDGECKLYFDMVVISRIERKTKLGGDIEQETTFSGYFCHKHKKQFEKIKDKIIRDRVHKRMSVWAKDLRDEGVDTPQLENLEKYLKEKGVN